MFCGDLVHNSPTEPSGTSSVVSGSTIRISTHGYGLPHDRSSFGFPTGSWYSGSSCVMAPVVSVSPYTWMNSQPNVSIALLSTESVIGDAPYRMARNVVKSVSSTPGVSNRNWITAGTKNAFVMPNRGMTSRINAGSTSRSNTVWQPWYKPTIE